MTSADGAGNGREAAGNGREAAGSDGHARHARHPEQAERLTFGERLRARWSRLGGFGPDGRRGRHSHDDHPRVPERTAFVQNTLMNCWIDLAAFSLGEVTVR